MADEPLSASLDRELTSMIVAAYVRQNQIASDQLGTLISTVRQALVGLGKPAIETEMDRTPTVPIRRSVHRDYVVCLECGWRGQMLRRHLATGHELSVDQYRHVNIQLPRQDIVSVDRQWRNRQVWGKVDFGGDREQRRHRKPLHREGDRGDHES